MPLRRSEACTELKLQLLLPVLRLRIQWLAIAELQWSDRRN
ncbi:MAG: hypothetical protein JWQ00_11, partial [Noviherbaspirillum sp.]|nr:hypothetical protein [Noviherbaspirillum sp.]